MGGNIPGGNFLGGNFPGGNFPRTDGNIFFISEANYFYVFLLSYCDKNHIERISVAVICFCFLTALKLMIMNT